MPLPSFAAVLLALRWETWAVPVIAISAILLVFSVGRMLAERLVTPAQSEHPHGAPRSHTAPDDGGANRRGFRRYAGNYLQIAISDEDLSGELTVARMLDHSLGGLGLLLNEEFPIGTILNVRAKRAPKSVPWTRVEVRYCRRKGNTFKMGVQFVQAPSLDVMAQFSQVEDPTPPK